MSETLREPQRDEADWLIEAGKFSDEIAALSAQTIGRYFSKEEEFLLRQDPDRYSRAKKLGLID